MSTTVHRESRCGPRTTGDMARLKDLELGSLVSVTVGGSSLVVERARPDSSGNPFRSIKSGKYVSARWVAEQPHRVLREGPRP